MMNQVVKCIVVDDEPHALNLVKGYVEQTPFLELVATCNDAKSAISVLTEKEVDLVFLDIQMPELTGLQLAERLVNGPDVVFTTAYDQYAIDGYKVSAIGYLLKPFSYEEFLVYALKTRQKMELQTVPQNTPDEFDDFIMVKADYKLWQIKLNDILFIEGVKDFAKIHRISEERPLVPLVSLKSLEAQLEGKGFMRVHRSYIVNLSQLGVIERGQVVYGETRITVSDAYKERFQNFVRTRSVN